MKIITDNKLNKYFAVTDEAIKKVKIINKEHGMDALDMAKRYYSDAKFFRDKGDYVNAFACLNYAHGWLDDGARIGLFDVGKDSKLFTVDDK